MQKYKLFFFNKLSSVGVVFDRERERARERDLTTYTNGRRWKLKSGDFFSRISTEELMHKSTKSCGRWVMADEHGFKEWRWRTGTHFIPNPKSYKNQIVGKNWKESVIPWSSERRSSLKLWIVQIRASSFYVWVAEDGRFGGKRKSQNMRYRLKMYTGRGGSAVGRNINSATRPKNHGFNILGSAILNKSLIPGFHGAGRLGPGWFHGFGWVLPTPMRQYQ